MTIVFQASNGQWVAAELDKANAPLVANRAVQGPWEKFDVINANDPNGSLEHDTRVNLKAANGLYVCAENGGGQELVANRSTAGPWETFILKRKAGFGSLQPNDQIGLQASNGLYVCAESGGGQPLIADRPNFGSWETFGTKISVPWTGKKRVRVEFVSVICADTEDLTGPDEFFAAGSGVNKKNSIETALLSIPFEINTKQTKRWPLPTSQRVLFEGQVDGDSTITLDCEFYDSDDKTDWNKNYGAMLSAISKGISTKSPKTGTYIDIINAGIDVAFKLDKNDLLGTVYHEFIPSNYPIGETTMPLWSFVRGKRGDFKLSSWNYQVEMLVTVF